MKLLKIGKDPSCNIVYNSPYVSSIHAELTLLDNGDIFIEDKNSTNGTFVGGQRLTPNVETQIHRGDLVKFGDTQLQWHQVPVLENPSKYKAIINIGTSHRCDINVGSQFASRYHATLFVDKKGKCTLLDNNSKNGTEVNGQKIPKGKRVALKHGDQVVIADEDISEQLKQFVPNPYGWVKKTLIGVVAAAALVGIIFGVKALITPDDGTNGGFHWFGDDCSCGNIIAGYNLNEAQKAVVMVYGVYTVYLELENNPIQDDIWREYTGNDPGRLKVKQESYSGTAFFLDREGRMGTNRHIAVPWEYEPEEKQKEWHNEAEQLMHDHLPMELTSAAVEEAYNQSNSVFWPMVRTQAIKERKGGQYANSLIRQLRNAKFKIVGELDYFGIAYPNRNYASLDEFARCTMLDYSKDREIDLALIQLNDPHTPESISWVFSPETFSTENIEAQKERLTWIGYPNGLVWALDPKIQKLRPQIRETMCSSMPSKYYFDIQGEIVGGASGSPVFCSKTGRLMGIAYGHLIGGSTYGRAIHAKYLKKMYDEELGR
ncbi:MAG: FHA domain-containing protein [Muribaculaceae bacterium]|nr:FHA domain-containing protein [Muribaculaceae bacterium]